MDLDRSTLSATLYFGRTLPDGNYRLTAFATDITDAAGNPLDGNADGTGGDNFTYDFYVLAGDANRDRNVDFNDLVALAQHYNTTSPTLDWYAADFNYDQHRRLQRPGRPGPALQHQPPRARDGPAWPGACPAAERLAVQPHPGRLPLLDKANHPRNLRQARGPAHRPKKVSRPSTRH
jgi:hypothetical protein